MSQHYAWFAVLIAIFYHFYSNEQHRDIFWKLFKGDFSDFRSQDAKNDERLFTVEELGRYNNLDDGLYLAIVGKIFDVTAGDKHYGPGATYHPFTGRDATLAFVTGEFTEEALTDDISSLSAAQCKSISTWVTFYDENYIYKGKLIGRYYNADGKPTTDYERFAAKVKVAEDEKSKEDEKMRMFPPCNAEWKPDVGTRFWCTKQSGGISRDWIGVPRQYFERPGGQYRCACVDLSSKLYKEHEANIREYEGCLEDSPTCTVLTMD